MNFGPVKFGIDRLLEEASRRAPLEGKRVGLVAHPASVTTDLTHSLDALIASGVNVTSAFGPQHGMRGDKQDNMIESPDFNDPRHNIPVFSLYGEVRRPTPEMMATFDVVLIDLQDLGCRIYTFITTLLYMLEEGARHSKSVWVLDRPNPLGGTVIEGNPLAVGFESFVGAFAGLPVRHGLTLAELVRLYLDRDQSGLGIWAMEGWRRDMLWPETGLFWVAPSPNMPTLQTAFLYPGGCLIEATELSEGRGTTRPFQLIGAPGVDPPALAQRLEESMAAAGARFVPTYFKPQFQKHGGVVCGGVELLASDPAAVRS